MFHAEHLPGTENVRAEWESRQMIDSRLDAVTGPFRAAGSDGGSIHSRFIHIKNKCSTPSVLQLATESRCPGSGRVLNPAERTETVPIPAICVDPQMSEQTEGRGCEGPTDSRNLAQPGLVWRFGETRTCDVTPTGTPNG